MNNDGLTRREMLRRAGVLGLAAAAAKLAPDWAYAATDTRASTPMPAATTGAQVREVNGVIDLTIQKMPFRVGARTGTAMCINGTVPGPIVRLREGQDAVIRVANRLEETSSIHWHGLLLPPEMDGVPGVSFAGIQPGETFTYRFPVTQSGTYWCHSHSGGQELVGVYAPMIIDPIEPEPFAYDRDYVVMFSDWTFIPPETLISKLKKQGGYFNYQKRLLEESFSDWSRMRMDPTDFADVTGSVATYLTNGLAPVSNWTGLFAPGERIRLRFINAAASTYFDVRIPGLKMTLVQVDGQNVKPVEIEEFRHAPAESYDVIIEPQDRAYSIFAESMDRSGFARGTLTPHEGLVAPLPPRRKRPLRTMADMGMDMAGMKGMDDMKGMAGMPSTPAAPDAHSGMQGMNGMAGMSGMSTPDTAAISPIPGSTPVPHGPDTHGPGNSIVPMTTRSRQHEPGTGLGENGRRVLVYTDLQNLYVNEDKREPGREIELHITGNMERYMWSFDGKKYSQAKEPIRFVYGEKLRLTFVNDTMMDHPLHLHGMWMYLENGKGQYLPRKHTVSVKPAERLSVAVIADAPGQWAFHCHLLLHMEMGMFRVIEVSDAPAATEETP